VRFRFVEFRHVNPHFTWSVHVTRSNLADFARPGCGQSLRSSPIGYEQEMVEVVHADGSVRAWVYVARPGAIDTSLLPYAWYHELVVHGAHQHGLPKRYVNDLKSFDTAVDPDTTRREKNLRFIDR
jgi:hypothetical protein